MPRVQVIRALAEAKTVLTPNAIHESILAMGGRIDAVSVYRIIGILEDAGLVHHVGLGQGYSACRLDKSHGETSEHIVCRSCGIVRELDVPAEAADAIRAQLGDEGYTSSAYKIEVMGICPACRTA